MQCLKCGGNDITTHQCNTCGIYFKKYTRYLDRKDSRKRRLKTLKERHYLFFLIHMFMFGGSGFFMAYSKSGPSLFFLYAHGGFAILVYTIFYIKSFGRDEVKWMFINSALGLMGIYSQIGWLLEAFGRNIDDYPLSAHVIPFLYYVLYTFLIRQLVLDLFHGRDDPEKKAKIQTTYVIASALFYGLFLIT